MKKDIRRNRKDKNLAGLYAIPNEIAYDSTGKLRKEVYGAVGKDTPFVYKPAEKSKGKSRTFVRDETEMPKVCKNRILAFFDDSNNKNKNVCFLAEKSLYEEMINNLNKKGK